jgi:hypothetical protein
MNAASLIPYTKRAHIAGFAARYGSIVAHHELLEQSLRHGVIESIEVFLPQTGTLPLSDGQYYLHTARQAVFEHNASHRADSIPPCQHS